jgi:hypothetical protein
VTLSSGSGSVILPIVRWVNSANSDTALGFVMTCNYYGSSLGDANVSGTWA